MTEGQHAGTATATEAAPGSPSARAGSADDLVKLHSSNTMIMQQKAHATRAGFKRPAFWVLFFGWSLALCAGLVNVVAMQSWGTYVSHVTGDTTAIGLRIEGYDKGRHDFAPLRESITVLLSFLFGAFLCGLLIDKNQVHFGGKSLYGIALVGNAVLLALSVVMTTDMASACLASMACGLQNAMCTSHFGAVVRTTHVTGTITDIGSTMGRMAMISLRNGCRRSRLDVLERAEVGVDARKLLVLGPMWVSFLLGCIAGAYLVGSIGVHAMLVPAGITFSMGSIYMLFRHRFKKFFKGTTQDRLNKDLEEVETSLSRTRTYLTNLRKRRPKPVAEEAQQPNSSIDFDDLESEVSHILDTIHHLEADLEDLCSHQTSPPLPRVEDASAQPSP
jgi:uncharacterized membrane protein YoaK (UPF0700 family)